MVKAMDAKTLEQLPPYARRRFVPAETPMNDWARIEPWFDRLEARASACREPKALEDWLLDWGELRAALDEAASRRYILMTCHTDDAQAEKDYLFFVEQIEPKLKPRQFRLEELFLAHPWRSSLPPSRYQVFARQTQARVEIFREANIPLETEESKLGQQYQKRCGAMSVTFQGQEKTLPQMERFQEETDRGVRQKAWELTAQRRLRDADTLEKQFEEMIRLRAQIAANAGFKSYTEYCFRAKGRFDYTPEDCLRFHEAVEQEVMPLVRELQAMRRRKLGLSMLRPWDLAVDPDGLPPLRPFTEAAQLAQGVSSILDRVDGGLAWQFNRMRELGLLDLANRKGKAPGGYQSTLAEARLPFIFMNAVGMQRDVETLLHEAGHAFHAWATQIEPFYPYREAPIEFCEVASMSMELIGNEFLDVFYSGPEARRARRDHLEGVLEIFPWIATVDAFQHWVYAHPAHTQAERRNAWLALMDRFGGEVDWSGYGDSRATRWHRQLHIFIHPFYYIEYGIAQLGALQVWVNARRDRPGALRAYQQALALGGSRPLPELFTAAGGRFDFSAATIRPLMAAIRKELETLE
jgi:oligoendopeptidase F